MRRWSCSDKPDMRHRNIPIFIPHMGCPNQCVFCNQRSISGCKEFHPKAVGEQIERALSTIKEDCRVEIAFFGGSFTGIDKELMIRLLELAEGYVREGSVASIRLSTRPDYISDEILEILSQYTVRNIELGLQSMDDEVLLATRRGHTAEQAKKACRDVVEAGFTLTGQMMIGLPASTKEKEILTARTIAELGASAVRVYPTVVFYDTPLYQMAVDGTYLPLSLSEAVARTADVLEIFEAAGIPCIRVGLCATEDLTSPEKVYDGPNHPALGELVMSECYYRRLCDAVVKNALQGKDVVLTVPAREVSRAVGQHRANVRRLSEETGARIVRVVPTEAERFTLTVENSHQYP